MGNECKYKKGLVSIIVPAYNIEAYIKDCLQSLMQQTYHDVEIIVVDDGSSDNTASLVAELSSNDKRIYLICQENGRTAKARNNGIDNAKGEFIMFVDGDDRISLDTIEKNIEHLNEDSSLDWVAFSILRVNTDLNPISTKKIYGNLIYKENEVLVSSKFVPYFDNHRLSGVCCGTIYRRESINIIRFPEGEFYEDGFFFTDVISYTNKGMLSKDGIYYYIHRAGSSQLQPLDRPRLKSDIKCSTKRLTQYRDIYPQFETIYREWEVKLYHYYKNEMAKGTEGGKEVYDAYIKQFTPPPHWISVSKELKYLIYRIIGYRNIKSVIKLARKVAPHKSS